MVDYSKWDNLDSDSDSDSGSATAAAAKQKQASTPAAAAKRVLDQAEVLRYVSRHAFALPMIQSGVEYWDVVRLVGGM